jgi:hypothetical protein
MKVTVIEQVEHSADITAEMVEAYLVRRGWILCSTSDSDRWFARADSPQVAVPINGRDWFVSVESIIGTIAW